MERWGRDMALLNEMTFSEYRSKAVKALWEHYSLEVVTRHPSFSTWRIDDICASFWRSRSDFFNDQCILELIGYIVHECAARRI